MFASGPWSSSRTIGSTIAAALLGIVGAVALVVVALVEEHASRTHAATAQVENTSRLVASYVSQTIQKMDMVTRDIEEHIRPSDMRVGGNANRAKAIHDLLARRLTALPGTPIIHITNANGDHIYSSMAQTPRINVGDRYHFTRQKNDPAAGLVISPPLVSRTTGKWSFVASRRLNFEDGSFAGIINLIIDLGELEKYFASVDVMSHGVVDMRNGDMVLMARFPPAPTAIGKPVPSPQATTDATHAVFDAPGVDGVVRRYSFRAIDNLGLFIFVGIAQEDYLSDWLMHVKIYGLATVVLATAVLAMVYLAWRGLIAQEAAGRAIHSANAYNRSLIEASLDPLVTIGADGKITDVNAATEAATGLGRTALIGTEFSDYFSEPDKARTGYQRVFREGRVHDYELEIRHRDGHLTPVLYNATVYRDDAGNVAGVFAAARNIAERRRAEDAVRQLNAELEDRVTRRTAELEATNRELEEFSYSVSHDMHAPLRAIDGYARLLLDEHGEALGDEARRWMRAIGSNVRQMSRLIDGLLLFLRMRKHGMTPVPLDLGAMVRLTFEELTDKLPPGRKPRLEMGDMPPARGDREMIQEVVRNLVSNALKFASPQRDLVIEAGGTAAPGENTYFVKDNGVGFDMRYVDKLFRVFERVHQTGEYEGAAIGLATVRRIVERHGGRVWAEGKVGEGACFRFSLPADGE